MKIPAIRAQIGAWVYYSATLTFKQVSQYVKRVDDELHKSELLREMLQRSITDNYKSIANYITHQEERFFNALVLAVYDGDPEWHEVRLEYDNGEEFFDIGILELTGGEKIFPVDGQHRVEGIKKVLESSSEYDNEKIPVVFIGHKKNEEGMQRARRMFSTLNRYAKPVSMRDIIALDEDDIIAIVSRDLLDNHLLLSNGRILDSKTKAIPDTNSKAFTTIITFYECNRELLWMMIKDYKVIDPENRNIRGKSKLKHYIRIRPQEEEIKSFSELCFNFWDSLMKISVEFFEYASAEKPDSRGFRNKEGGLLLFRPAALIPFVKAAIRIKENKNCTFEEVFKNFPDVVLQLKNKVWRNVLWNSEKRTMVMNNQNLVELLLVYFYDKSMISKKEENKMINELKNIRQLTEIEDVIEILKGAIDNNDE
ncbi:MAG: DNA sulfur modification protein DndB [Desulfosporosinus sp.]|nr:DNA sulfur modification protein DndB [Desulfosporosinus sp.]